MTDRLHELEADLRLRLAELEERMAKLKRDAGKEHSADSAEQAQERENDEVVDAIGIETRSAIASIKAALQRVAEGSYGDCERCGEPIAPERLRALPETTLCIRCAE